ncbi:MAG: CDP-glycerol glycerophosphotransferase family protein, partial [Lachnospiraceae bacterium]|nr:CDP-glycerol glycerophosphotransferase family protein [Lachnospiraceae bacterium]
SSKLEYDLHHADYKNRPYNKIFDVGYPAFETYHALVTKEGKNRILWTPRWTYEEAYGGSHFFEYIDAFIQFAKDHPDVTLTIRPHPLMFDQLIEQKTMTLEDVEQIKRRCADAGIRFDTNRIVADTFTETDILVTDYSSLIKLFLVMGKPVLYCKTNIAVNTEFEELMQAMYLSDNWDEIEKTLMDLTSGKDDLKEKREQMVSDILLRKKNAVSEIANVLLQDHKDNCG